MSKENDADETIPPEEAAAAAQTETDVAETDVGPEAEDTATDAAMQLMQQLEKAQAEFEDMKARYLRSVADLENFRKRIAREKQDIIRNAAANVVEELVPVLDHMKIGLDAADKHPEAKDVTSGFRMVFEQFKQVLGQQGLEELRPDGATFDPNVHECIAHQPSEAIDEGNVIETVRAGYRLNDRLIRAANVIVSSGKAEG